MIIILSFISGVLLWTFIEYIFHRFLGHVHKGKNFFKKEHLQHHSKYAYFAPVYKKIISALLFFGLFLVILSFLVSTFTAASFLIGFYSMYGLYELAHYRFHAKSPLAYIFLVLRKHHFYHHFHNPKTNFGVTSRLWDRVFGTFTPVEKVRVPKKMAMVWLLEGTEIKKTYSTHFYFA